MGHTITENTHAEVILKPSKSYLSTTCCSRERLEDPSCRRIMRTYHTHFDVPLGTTSGWWDDRKRNQKPVLPLYLRLDIPSNLSRALSCLRLSGQNFLVQRMRHDRNRKPYELRICDRCDWHIIQDEERILLDCPHEHLVRLRTQQQLIFPPQFEDDPARLRTFINQPDIFGWSCLFCS